MKKWVFATDYHGDRSDPAVEIEFFKFLKSFKPDLKIFGGDLVDLRPLRKGASTDEKNEGLRSDVEAGFKFLKKYKPHVFTFGNHDDRLRETGEGGGPLAEYAAMGYNDLLDRCKAQNTQVVPYEKRHYYQLGTHKVIHGFASGVYAARKHSQHYGPCIFGHIHAFTQAPCESVGIGSPVTWSSGCMCRVDMGYNARHLGTIRQEAGWLYGIITKSGKVEIFSCRSDTDYYNPYEKNTKK